MVFAVAAASPALGEMAAVEANAFGVDAVSEYAGVLSKCLLGGRTSCRSIINEITSSLTPAFFNSIRPAAEISNFVFDVRSFLSMMSADKPAFVISIILELTRVSGCANAGMTRAISKNTEANGRFVSFFMSRSSMKKILANEMKTR